MNKQLPIYPEQVSNEVPVAQPAPYGVPPVLYGDPSAQMYQSQAMNPNQSQSNILLVHAQQNIRANATSTITPVFINP